MVIPPILFLSIIWVYADNVVYQYPHVWDFPDWPILDDVYHSDYIDDSVVSVTEFCLLEWLWYWSYVQWTKTSSWTAVYNPTFSVWERDDDDVTFAEIVTCTDTFNTPPNASVTTSRQLLEWEQDITLNWTIISNESFMSQAELFNLYQLEFTILLVITFPLVLNKFLMQRKKGALKYLI